MNHTCMCGEARLEEIFHYTRAPQGETQFDLAGQPYERRVLRCQICGHFVSYHSLELESFYEGAYVEATYGADGLRRAFERIRALPADASDNVARVQRIRDYATKEPPAGITLLDVGSGLGVFPAAAEEDGWKVTALDPDPRAAEHLRHHVGVPAIAADFMAVKASDVGSFDAVTFNKVLEHVEDPVAMLARAAEFLTADGFVYVELPDGEAAVKAGATREEFFIEHHHVFSFASIALLGARAGMELREAERVREPSDKYTLRAFMAVASRS